MTLRIMMKLKSCLKTTKAHKLVEDFTEEAPDVTLASVMTTVVMLISFLFREEAILKLRTNLRMHLRRFMGLGFTCDECAYDFALFNNFINKTHEGKKYPCRECEYQAATNGSFAQHQRTIHEGKKYPWRECD